MAASLYEMLGMMADAILGNAAYDAVKMSIQRMFEKNNLTKEEVIHALQIDASLMLQFNDISSKIENNFINSQILGSTINITNNATHQINSNGFLSDQKLMSELADAYKGYKRNYKSWNAVRGNNLQNVYVIFGMIFFIVFTMILPMILKHMGFEISNNNLFMFTGIIPGLILMGYFFIKIRPKIEYEAKLYADYRNKYERLRAQAIDRGIARPEDMI